MSDRWFAMGASHSMRRPEVGDVVAWERAAWTVMHVATTDPTDDEVKYLKAYRAEIREKLQPYKVSLRRLHGPQSPRENSYQDMALRARAANSIGFQTYPAGRVPLCSCCGHPWPCLMLDSEREAELTAKVMSDRMDRVMPGVCFGCGEPVTSRQKAARFPEPNVQVPGSPPPVFHMRNSCFEAAYQYERDRRLLYPDAPRLAGEHGWVIQESTFDLLDAGDERP